MGGLQPRLVFRDLRRVSDLKNQYEATLSAF